MDMKSGGTRLLSLEDYAWVEIVKDNSIKHQLQIEAITKQKELQKLTLKEDLSKQVAEKRREQIVQREKDETYNEQ
jgi:hypothetical protein